VIRYFTIALLGLSLLSCQENEEPASQEESNYKSMPDSVPIQPNDLNNTLFMYHFETTQMLDSLFYAPPSQMKSIYESLIFNLDIKIQDLKSMSFEFKEADDFIASAELMMENYYQIMTKDFPPVMKVLMKDSSLTAEEKSAINSFEEKFDEVITPVAQDFFAAQERFAKAHKIELVDYE
jgi:hypothetical protein